MRFEQHEEPLKKYAVRLAALLADDVKVSPIILDGANHEEKIRFVQKFIHFLQENQAPYQYAIINVGQSGKKSQLAMMSFLSDLADILPAEIRGSFCHAAEDLLHMASEQNILLEGYLKKKNMSVLAKEISSAEGEGMLQQYVHAQESIRDIRDILGKYTEENPVLIFVDGMDACTDDFKVKLLHAINMIFKAKNLQFVLLAGREPLLASITRFCDPAASPEAY